MLGGWKYIVLSGRKRMSTISWYALRQFFKPFITAFISLCILVMFSQVVDRLDRFLSDGVSLKHVIGYLLTSTPFQAMNILPISVLLGTLFVVSNLVRTREYIAGLAGGIPPEKFLSGIVFAGLGISLLALLANETVIPHATEYSRSVYREKIQRLGEWRQTIFTDLCVLGIDGRIWNTPKFDESSGKMDRVVIDHFKDGSIVAQIDAQSAQWSKDGWTFDKGVIRQFDPQGNQVTSFEKFEQRRFDFSEKPGDLVIQEPQPEEMNFNTLKKHILHLSSLGVPTRKLEVELMMKLAFPFSCFIVTVLGIPLALGGRGNRGKGIAFGAILTMSYMGFMQFGKAMAQRLIPPLLGAWMGNLFFLALAAYLWFRMRRSV